MTKEQKDKNKIQLTKEVLRTVKNFQPKEENQKIMTHVTKKTAQLLKEKGFDLPCRQYYATGADTNELIECEGVMSKNYNSISEYHFTRPTLHEATDWLRTKGAHVYVRTSFHREWGFDIEDTQTGKDIGSSNWDFNTHDLALEAGIVHALKNYVK